MNDPVNKIAVIQGAPSVVIQDLFQKLVDRWRPAVRIAGVIAESHGLADRACSAGYFRNIATGEAFPIFEDLGPGSTACHIEGGGALTAAAAVQRDINAGCDLVVLSKFGKLEAAGAGLLSAFKAAFDANLPLLTSVSPAFDESWAKLASPSFTVLPADPVQVDAWWQAARSCAPTIDSRAPSGANFSDR